MQNHLTNVQPVDERKQRRRRLLYVNLRLAELLQLIVALRDEQGRLQPVQIHATSVPQSAASFFPRMEMLAETSQNRLGQAEMRLALSSWLRQAKLSKSNIKRLVKFTEDFRAEESLDEFWCEILRKHMPTVAAAGGVLTRKKAIGANAGHAANLKIMSLGTDCLPWQILNRWGLRPPSDIVDLDVPFNLAVHNLPTLIRLLSSGFEGYTDPARFDVVITQNGHKVPYHRDYKAVFNHFHGSFWSDNNFEQLIEVLCIKVENVRRALKQRKLALLISNPHYEDREKAHVQLKTLYACLEQLALEPPLLIASNQRDFSSDPQITKIAEKIYHMNRAFPDPKYVWYRDFDTAPGMEFEQAYISDFCSILSAHGLWA